MTISTKTARRWQLEESQRAIDSEPPGYHMSIALSACPFGQTPSPTPACKFLIANPRLEFPLTHSKQRTGATSNRERMAISCLTFSVFSGFEPEAASLHNLIVTPRLEFRATRTKQTSSSISNRYKMDFSRLPQSHPCFRVLMPLAAHATIRVHTSR